MGTSRTGSITSRWQPSRPQWIYGWLDEPGFWRVRPAIAAGLFLLYLLMHASLELFGELLAIGDPRLVTILPSVGLLMAVLMIAPRRTWPLWLAGALCAEIFIETLVLPLDYGLVAAGTGFVRATAALIATVIAARALFQALRMSRPFYFLFVFNMAVGFAAIVAGLINAVVMNAAGLSDQLFLTWRVDTFAIYLGMALSGPLVIAWTVGPRQIDSHPRARLTEMILLGAFTLLVVALALKLEAGAQVAYLGEARFSIYVLLLIPCIWAAVRFDMRALSAVLAVVAVTVVVGTGHGLGPFAGRSESDVQLLSRLQWYLLVVVQLAWMLHAFILERARALEVISAQRNVSEVLVNIAAKFTDNRRENLERTIVESLETITRFTNADRCALVEIDEAAGTFNETHTWQSTERLGPPARLRCGTLVQFDWAIRQLEDAGQFVLSDLTRDLPSGAGGFRVLARTGRAAVAYVALRFEGKLIGAVGFEWGKDRFRWSSEVVALMHIIGQLFTNMLRRRQTAETLSSYQKKLRSMARELSLSDERARRRTATDLHDGIGQNLAVAKIKLGQLVGDAEGDHKHIAVLQELMEDALTQSRSIIADLSPSILYDFGFAAAVRWLADRTERLHDGVQCTLKETGEPWMPGDDSRIAMFRCVRELVQNCIRHANASKISIHADWREDDVHICVSDNGDGFAKIESLKGDLDEEGHGFGLFSLRETVHVLGGEMIIDSTRGEGAAVSFSVLRDLAQS